MAAKRARLPTRVKRITLGDPIRHASLHTVGLSAIQRRL
jgi:hypothetical protein